MLKANELRIGNYHYYHIVDEMDERKEFDEISQIDGQDIVYLENNPDDPDYKPVPLTEEWLLRSGCEKNDEGFICDRFVLTWNAVYKFWYVRENQLGAYLTKLEYVHEWQNFYFVLQGEELTLKDK